ncbi:MAG: 50S ribosomal protein L1 [Nanoarchaeota archaeon]|nr:50S ribosomal protein L1 [Nanoarchaeota archaeon]MBU0962752.1 50S ribosomal protein L1 [Nanoarchaeota archaeon]
MEKKDFLNTLKKLREESKKRNFSQSVDLIINLKGIDLKKEEHKVDQFLTLPHERGKAVKVCAFVDKQLIKNAREDCDLAILNEDFPEYAGNKKTIKKLARDYSYFIAQVNIMSEVAKTFGKIIGTRGKMPNPKAGCVVPGTADLKPLVLKLKKLVRITTKAEPTIKTRLGLETMKDEELADNALYIYSHLIDTLPQGKHNIKNIFLKFTMSKPHEIKESENESTKLEKARS